MLPASRSNRPASAPSSAFMSVLLNVERQESQLNYDRSHPWYRYSKAEAKIY